MAGDPITLPGEAFATAPQQRRILAQTAARSAGPHQSTLVLRFSRPVDPAQVLHAVDLLVRRHEILRTTYRAVPGTGVPVQVIHTDLPPRWELRETGTAQNAVDAALTPPLDIVEGPVLCATLAPRAGVLVLVTPAASVDVDGLVVLARLLARELGAGTQDGADPLQYADLATVFEELPATAEAAPAREFWQTVPAAPPLPPSFAPESPVFEPAVVDVPLTTGEMSALAEVAGGGGAVRGDAVIATWSLHLRGLTGEPQVIAVRCDGRTYDELVDVVGVCARHLPVQDSGAPEVAAAVTAFRGGIDTVREWQDYYPGDLRDGRFEFCADHRVVPAPLPAGANTVNIDHVDDCPMRFLLRLVVTETQHGLQATLQYNRERVSTRHAEELANGFAELVRAVIAGETAAVRLPLVGRAQRDRLLDLAKGPALDLARSPVPDRVAEAARRRPDKVAIESAGTAMTFRDLDDRADRLAAMLVQRGVRPETRVAVAGHRTPDTVVALLAVLKAGGCFVPVDPALPPARRKAVVAGADIMLARTRDDDMVTACLPGAVLFATDADEGIGGPPGVRIEPDTAFAVLHTSGSTGEPKGVVLTHRGVSNRIAAGERDHPLRPGDRVLAAAGFGFDFALWELLAPLIAGATVVLASDAERESAADLVTLMRRAEVTVAHFVPSMLRLVVEQPELAECRVLRRVYAGGEPLTTDLVSAVGAAVGAEVVNQYGPTECSIDVTAARCQPGGQVSIGAPMANISAYVLDPALCPVPPGVIGELYIAGHALARGYTAAALTAERFVPDPFGSPGHRMYRTGDLVRRGIERGLEFIGRADRQVKIRGFRIEPAEIEETLVRHPAVLECAVMNRPDASGAQTLVCHVVWSSGSTMTTRELRDFLAAELPAYLVPSMFVELDALPRTPAGKVDYTAVRVLGGDRPVLGTEYRPPRTGTEQAVARVWSALLGIERIGVTDHFLDLGGHSLLATRLIARLTAEFGARLSLLEFFDNPTVAWIAGAIDEQTDVVRDLPPPARDATSPTRLLTVLRMGPGRTPVFLVRPGGEHTGPDALILDSLDREQPVYQLRVPAEPTGVEAVAAAHAALVSLVCAAGPCVLVGQPGGEDVAAALARVLAAGGSHRPELLIAPDIEELAETARVCGELMSGIPD